MLAELRDYSAPDRGAKYCDERVCLSVCLCVCLAAIVSSEQHVRSSPIFVHVTYGRGSVLLWWRSDTLCTFCLWMTSYLLIIQG